MLPSELPESQTDEPRRVWLLVGKADRRSVDDNEKIVRRRIRWGRGEKLGVFKTKTEQAKEIRVAATPQSHKSLLK